MQRQLVVSAVVIGMLLLGSRLTHAQMSAASQLDQVTIKYTGCHHCQGTGAETVVKFKMNGREGAAQQPCTHCSGNGYRNQPRRVTIIVPKGTKVSDAFGKGGSSVVVRTRPFKYE